MALLARGQLPQPQDAVLADEEIRDPCLLEFLNLKDEYSESELEVGIDPALGMVSPGN